MKSRSAEDKLIANAFRKQSSELLDTLLEIAERSGLPDEVERLAIIGDWQRITWLDRMCEHDYLSEDEVNLLFEEGKRRFKGRGEPNLDQFRTKQITDWENATVRDRLIGFGISSLLRPIYGAGNPDEDMFLYRLAIEALAHLSAPDIDELRKQIRSDTAKQNANLGHDKPNGTRAKRSQMIAIWASGKYTSRDICAEQECAALDMSFSTARKALRGMPEPRLAAATKG